MKLTSTILISLPLLMGGFVQFIISQFYQKFATDALLLESAVVGSIFFISRVSDAVLDPVCGYLSDRLRSRRAFIFLGLIALALGTYTAFLPALFETAPLALRYAFAACGIFILYLGVTLVYIPHYAWLAALYRTTKAPLFAARAVIENFGTILGGAALALLVPYQTSVTGKGGSLLTTLGIMLVGPLLLGIFPLLLYKSTVDDTPSIPSFFHSMKTLLKNKRFTFVSLMSFFNQFAATTLLAVSLYYSDYVLHNKELGVTMTIVFLLSATIFVPLWSYLTRHFSRYTLWSLALLIIVAMSPTLLLAENGFAQYVIVFAFVAGAAAGAVLLF
ncbi:MAG TPA: MFS transporter, partial [Turneriella sp.]|nr:MFS transporter [Turneriella sp.]